MAAPTVEDLKHLRTTLEKDRDEAAKQMKALQDKIRALEIENQQLKSSGASASTSAAAPAASAPAGAAGGTGKIPFGHTAYSWAQTGPSNPPFGHTPYSWMEGAGAPAADGAGGAAPGVAPVSFAKKGVQAEGKYNRFSVAGILASEQELVGQSASVCGWARSVRVQGAKGKGAQLAFLALNDGSCLNNVQVVLQEKEMPADKWELLNSNAHTGTAWRVTGMIVKSPARGQNVEVHGTEMELLGSAPADVYPLAKGKHPLEHLREHAHLRPRSIVMGAMMRVRNRLAAAVHEFYQQQGFMYVHAPLITSADCEGAGEMFAVSSLFQPDKDPRELPGVKETGKVDYSEDFFGTSTFLTVSGQLEAEAYACSMSKVYTFGPTFRAENSHTTRHLSEFWMIEPEIAFADLNDDMDLAEGFLKFTCGAVLRDCADEVAFFEEHYLPGLTARLTEIVEKPFVRLTYTDAQKQLQEAADKGRKWENSCGWGEDLASEHERYLTEEVYKGPVFVTDWPKDIKAFYMKVNDDNKTVAAMDCLLPKVGEIIGGSQREERLDVLLQRMEEMNVPKEHLEWYLDLRRYGTCQHAGFGLGFERLVMFCTGLDNIRDVIPFPRYPGHAAF